jgi:hypothetical protein
MKTCDDLVNALFPFRCRDRPGPDVEARIIQPARDPSSDQPKFILAAHQGAVARREHFKPGSCRSPGAAGAARRWAHQRAKPPLPHGRHDLAEIDRLPDVAVGAQLISNGEVTLLTGDLLCQRKTSTR